MGYESILHQGVASAPNEDGTDSLFNVAAIYNLTIQSTLPSGAIPLPAEYDLRLQINYVGDVARVYINGTLISDNFYNSGPYEFGLNRFINDGIYNGGSSGSQVRTASCFGRELMIDYFIAGVGAADDTAAVIRLAYLRHMA